MFSMIETTSIGIVIPYYNAAKHIVHVVEKATRYADHIVIINDASPDTMPVEMLNTYQQVQIINNKKNLGVGGATLKGIEVLIKNPEIKVIVKLDADDQMDTTFIPKLVQPILNQHAHFVKGNRFRDLEALKSMPTIRRFGNLFLSFLSKVSTGYWNCFDFNNGFFAISSGTVSKLNTTAISKNYFFETSLIGELYFQQAIIAEIPMPAIYGDEESNMKLFRMPWLFSINLFKKFITRIWKSYFVYDFNIGTVYLVFGVFLFLGGTSFGGYNWSVNSATNELTPVGTIMISTLLIILGFQLLLQAIQFDILRTPTTFIKREGQF
jgi:dolichol-phosphate mannosyltransferase